MDGGEWRWWQTLAANAALSVLGAMLSYKIILEYIPIFVARKMYGNDQCKVRDPVEL